MLLEGPQIWLTMRYSILKSELVYTCILSVPQINLCVIVDMVHSLIRSDMVKTKSVDKRQLKCHNLRLSTNFEITPASGNTGIRQVLYFRCASLFLTKQVKMQGK